MVGMDILVRDGPGTMPVTEDSPCGTPAMPVTEDSPRGHTHHAGDRGQPLRHTPRGMLNCSTIYKQMLANLIFEAAEISKNVLKTRFYIAKSEITVQKLLT